ncbi:hypothetical protein GWI33_012289 [Rhynchophorus ferrugineus]|uniref:Uncharacterized protein n=1 Tax=Rhynchophorus ferrugineus TaxID=354439 RepID=A0A834ME99_RHYFE|nr:hypothetical protein GWI33_012289 [Rhynchophorus ferrugineus]
MKIPRKVQLIAANNKKKNIVRHCLRGFSVRSPAATSPYGDGRHAGEKNACERDETSPKDTNRPPVDPRVDSMAR